MTQLPGRLCLVLMLILALLGAIPVAAQTTGAVVEGVVSDEQRAVLPGAGVTIVNVETGWTRDMVTNERGWCRAAALPPGLDQLRVEMSGFASVVEPGLALTLGQEATINVTLKLATVEETVTVTGGHRWSRRPRARSGRPSRAVLSIRCPWPVETSPGWRLWRPASRVSAAEG